MNATETTRDVAVDVRAMMLGADAVIFDVDGTLVDSVDFHTEAW